MLSIFKWSGSKRSQAETIIDKFPSNITQYYEPFVGSGIVMLSLLENHPDKLAKNCKIICSDLNKDLIDLWNIVKTEPEKLLSSYKENWERFNLKGNDKNYRVSVYNEIRAKYNETKDSYLFFFLMRTSINGLIRYNLNTGNFNAPCHFTRAGMKPEKIEEILTETHNLIVKYDVQFICGSYETVLSDISEDAVVYMDPPYYDAGQMYFGNFDHTKFNEFINNVSAKNIFISFDGKKIEDMDFSKYERLKIYSGKSSFMKLHQTDKEVFESLYIRKDEH